MTPCRLIGEQCVVADCMRPARELGGYCTRCWMALTALERQMMQEDAALRTLTECDEALLRLDAWERGDTEPIDVLEVWWRLPPIDPEQSEAA